MGKAHASLGKYQKALEYYGQAPALARATGIRRNEWIYLYHIARVERDRGHLTEALARAEAALDVIESLRSKVGNRPLRASFFAQKQSLFEFYIDVLMRLHQQTPGGGYQAAALRAAERARARNLLDLLAEAGVDIRQSVDPALLGRERHLQEQVNAKERERMKLLSGKHTEEQAAAVDKELTAALTNYQEVERQIRAQSPGYAALTRPRPLGLKQIQQQVLDEDTLLLEYALGKERSFLWAVTPTSIKSYELPERGKIETAARRVYDLLTARNKWVKFETSEEKRARVARAEAEYPKAAAALSRMLLGPVVEQLGQKRLLVVTEGALQYVPLAALPKPRRQVVDSRSSTVDSRHRPAETRVHGLRSAVQPLIVDHEVVSLPSASVLAVLRRKLRGRRRAGKSVAVLADAVFAANDPRVRGTPGKQRKKPGESAGRSAGPPRREEALTRSARAVGITGFTRLIYTRREAEAIAAMAGEKPHLRALDFAASRATVMRADLGQYRVLHFATHGLLNSLHPELSGIVLSLVDERGEPQDGFLRLNEIYNLKLGADLVVLSGCQTALGKEVRGEGLVGLTRGFMYAGAARVMASLWKVADASTAELMKRFYRGMLGEGLRPAEALRAAQVSMWRQRRWKSPYYWAAFVLQGEWR